MREKSEDSFILLRWVSFELSPMADNKEISRLSKQLKESDLKLIYYASFLPYN